MQVGMPMLLNRPSIQQLLLIRRRPRGAPLLVPRAQRRPGVLAQGRDAVLGGARAERHPGAHGAVARLQEVLGGIGGGRQGGVPAPLHKRVLRQARDTGEAERGQAEVEGGGSAGASEQGEVKWFSNHHCYSS